MLDYVKAVKLANLWSQDVNLTAQQRLLAKHLADLAGILIDPGYGCPTEHAAAEKMFHHLSKSISQERSVH
ncbi:MAG: hypothetical protein WCL27_14680 [Betaproteobacteria bacterium]